MGWLSSSTHNPHTGEPMSGNWKTCLLPALLTLPVVGADWPAIPPEVWTIKEDSVKGIKDAVILEDRTIFKLTCIERIRRVRILSEAGRKAVEPSRTWLADIRSSASARASGERRQ